MKSTSPDLSMLLAATGYLMTHYSLRSSEPAAHGVVHHLEMLLAHPQVIESPRLREAYQGLLKQWQEIATRQRRTVDHRHVSHAERLN